MTALHVLRRELRALLFSPQSYAIGAAFLIISGIFFINILISSEIPDLEQYYSNIANTLIVLVPVVAMRSFAEERRTGALDITLAWPTSRMALVLGKFAANTVFLWFLSSVVWLYYHLVGGFGQIQMGRTAGGFIGLLLMAMAFSALALMVSARASSPAGAAFLGFGLLLFLWILDYAPGWIGDWLAALGPTDHFAAFPKGVIYWHDVAYFLVATLVGVGTAVAILERDHPGRALGSLLRRGAALGVVAVLSTGTVALAGDIEGQVDLSPTKENTITATTRDVIRRLDRLGEPVRLTGFSPHISREASRLRALVKQYRAAGARIELTIIDPDAQPGKARQAGITGYGEAFAELSGRREAVTDATQGSLTSALLRLSHPTRPRVCFTAGHGERDIADRTQGGASTLADAMRYLGHDIRPIALAAVGAEAELGRCAVVVVAGPQVPFLPAELELLGSYARNQGRLLLLADAFSSATRDQLNQLLAPFGVSFGAGVVSDRSALADDPSSVVSLDYGAGTSPPVARLSQDNIPVVLSNTLAVEASEAAQKEGTFGELIRSSRKSSSGDGQAKREGPFVLAALADRSELGGTQDNPQVSRTRIGLVGTADIMANRTIDTLGNRQFITELVQWVGHEDDVISAGRPPTGFNKIAITADDKNRLIRQGIVLPTLAVLLPLPLAARRLRRG
jgi:ABC-type transport system involved in multi-copper enzyme maturation permease subunit